MTDETKAPQDELKAAPQVEANPHDGAQPAGDTGPESVEPAKRRGRGRPKAAEADPAKETVTGAPRATAKKRSAVKSSVGVSGPQLVGLHELAFMVSGQQFPEIRIQSAEGDMLANAINGVCAEYDLAVDGKTGAFLNLLGAAAMIYAPRVLAIRQRIRAAQPVDVEAKAV